MPSGRANLRRPACARGSTIVRSTAGKRFIARAKTGATRSEPYARSRPNRVVQPDDLRGGGDARIVSGRAGVQRLLGHRFLGLVPTPFVDREALGRRNLQVGIEPV